MMDAVSKFNNYMTQHTDKVPLLSVQSVEDRRFKVLREFLAHIYGDVEDNAWSVGQHLSRFVDSLSTMNDYDIDKIVYCAKKYEVKGTHGGIHGKGTYGYDVSRVDRALIKRKRTN
jgi:hypothetical protein